MYFKKCIDHSSSSSSNNDQMIEKSVISGHISKWAMQSSTLSAFKRVDSGAWIAVLEWCSTVSVTHAILRTPLMELQHAYWIQHVFGLNLHHHPFTLWETQRLLYILFNFFHLSDINEFHFLSPPGQTWYSEAWLAYSTFSMSLTLAKVSAYNEIPNLSF